MLANFRIDRLKRERERIGEILPPQRKCRRNHLHNDGDQQTEDSHDHRESDHGVDGI